jgi:16S rRNA (uracil1498-N3)-methyltransferase
MELHLLFADDWDGDKIELSDEEMRHARALRIQENQHIRITNGNGKVSTGYLEWQKKQAIVRIEKTEIFEHNFPSLHLAVAPTKNTDRLEWLVEKSVEIGIDQISLIDCQHSERSQLRIDRLKKLSIAALKQSQKYFLPIIHELKSFDEWIQMMPAGYIAHCNQDYPRNHLAKSLRVRQNAVIAIGPEGDFSSREIELAISLGWQCVSLGNSRLRTETAGMVAVAIFETVNSSSEI